MEKNIVTFVSVKTAGNGVTETVAALAVKKVKKSCIFDLCQTLLAVSTSCTVLLVS